MNGTVDMKRLRRFTRGDLQNGFLVSFDNLAPEF
jgi:hypothetical protein